MNLRQIAGATLLAGLATVASAHGDRSVEVEIYDRTAGRTLPVYWHEGERHVAGEPGHEYEIRIRNREQGRLLAVTSVDGVNVITGRTASPRQTGYVVGPRGSVAIDGWRKSLGDVASFFFTALPDSYAARTGRPDDVGVIGVALFRERRVVPRPYALEPAAAPAPHREAEKTVRATGDAQGVEDRLGTGHGARRDSPAEYTDFERATDSPFQVIRIYYDSHRNLVARGVIPGEPHYARRRPDPFPGGFVPDP